MRKGAVARRWPGSPSVVVSCTRRAEITTERVCVGWAVGGVVFGPW
jgi:hypothetical protein